MGNAITSMEDAKKYMGDMIAQALEVVDAFNPPESEKVVPMDYPKLGVKVFPNKTISVDGIFMNIENATQAAAVNMRAVQAAAAAIQ